MLLYDVYFRKFVSKKYTAIANPLLVPLKRLEIPKGSVLHYLGESLVQSGPDEDLYIYRLITTPIQMSVKTRYSDLVALRGNPTSLSTNIKSDVDEYLRRHRRYRRMTDISKIHSAPHIELIINYAPMDRGYKYIQNDYAHYNAWYNKFASVIESIEEAVKLTGREQFLVFDLPSILPGISRLKAVENQESIPKNYLPNFTSSESRVILELWRWLSEYRQYSLFNNLSPRALAKTNIIFRDSGAWIAYRLDVLDRFRLATRSEVDAYTEQDKVDGKPEPNAKGVEASMLKMNFMRGLMALMQARTGHVEDADDEQVSDDSDDNEVEQALVKDRDGNVIVTNVVGGRVQLKEGIAQSRDQDVINRAAEIEKERDRQAKDSDFVSDAAGLPIDEYNRQISEDLDVLDKLNDLAEKDEEQRLLGPAQAGPGVLTERNKTFPSDYDEALLRIAEDYAEDGVITTSDYRRAVKNAQAYKTIKMPNGQTMEEFVKYPRERLKLDYKKKVREFNTVTDDSLINSSMVDFHRNYNTDLLHRDIAAMFLGMQYGGTAITNFQIHKQETVLGARYIYEARLSPVDGDPSTARVVLPEVDKDGVFRINGVKYRFRTQQAVHLPIKKTGPYEVSLTSYYGKLFIQRTQRKVNDYGAWITKKIKVDALTGKGFISEAEAVPVFQPDVKRPRIFTILSQNFTGFKVNSPNVNETLAFNFDNVDLVKKLGAERYDSYVTKGQVPCGFAGENLILVDGANQFFIDRQGNLDPIGTMESLLEMDASRAPLEYVEAKISRKDIPVGFILAYMMGLEQLFSLLGPQVRRVPRGSHVTLSGDEYRLIFNDETVILNRNDKVATLILSGLTKFHRSLKNYSIHDFNRPDVYLNVLEEHGMPVRIGASIDSLRDFFIDPITRELLQDMKEPDNFRGLLVRSAEMLIDDYVPEVKDRIRGYERFAGAVYSELIKAHRAFRFKPSRSRQSIDLNPFAVFNNIATDTAKLQVKDINPVEDVKQLDALSYTGNGGRSSLSMTRSARLYTKKEQGLVSEGTADSGKVGVNNYACRSPKLTSLRGMYDEYDVTKDGVGHLLSTSANISPYITFDDGKRSNFAGVQHGHGIYCNGYRTPIVRTGAESTLTQQTTQMFAKAAEQDGVVVNVRPEGIVVRYADGTQEGYILGKQFGQGSSMSFPFTITTELKKGQAFKAGDVLTYNQQFFAKDTVSFDSPVWMNGTYGMLALVETNSTYEDATCISEDFAKRLVSRIADPKSVVMNFNEAIHQLVKVGQRVSADDHLCIIENEITSGSSLFDEDSIAALRLMKADTPRAGVDGVVERIEVYYNGEIEDMSESVREIVLASDKQFAREQLAVGKGVLTGSVVGESYRVNRNPLLPDQIAIVIHISEEKSMGVGDKAVVCNQLKTVISEVVQVPRESESGIAIDMDFGTKSAGNRIVNSIYEIGIDGRLCLKATERAIAAFTSSMT